MVQAQLSALHLHTSKQQGTSILFVRKKQLQHQWRSTTLTANVFLKKHILL
ncbi:hypothetical protein OIU77_001169, partial [Salix suchowensis]